MRDLDYAPGHYDGDGCVFPTAGHFDAGSSDGGEFKSSPLPHPRPANYLDQAKAADAIAMMLKAGRALGQIPPLPPKPQPFRNRGKRP